MNMKKYTFNMICSCVARDIFGIKHEDKGWELNKNQYFDVLQYINFVSPFRFNNLFALFI